VDELVVLERLNHELCRVSGRAADDQRPALPGSDVIEHPVDLLELAVAPNES
jgi:hypothetical protein